MSDEVRNAASIGAAINRGLGTIPVGRKKKGTKDNKGKDSTAGAKKVRSSQVSEEKPDKNIIDAVVVEPTMVKSERINAPKAITTGQKQLPYNPSVGAQFKDYADTYGSTHTQKPTDLRKL